MNRDRGIALLAGALIVFGLWFPAVSPGKPVIEQEPYGGCDEAWQYPDTEGAAWCRERGLIR